MAKVYSLFIEFVWPRDVRKGLTGVCSFYGGNIMKKIVPALIITMIATSPLHAEGFWSALRTKIQDKQIKAYTRDATIPQGIKPAFWHLILTNGTQIVDQQCSVDTKREELFCKHGIYSAKAYKSVRMITGDDPEYAQIERKFWENH